MFSVNCDLDQSRIFLKNNCVVRRFDLTEFTGSSKNEGRSHVRMTGKWDLARRSENSDAPCVTSTRRKNERALGKIKLARDLLHLIRREPFGFWQHSQLIPAEASLRKHVADVISVFHILVFQGRLLLYSLVSPEATDTGYWILDA